MNSSVLEAQLVAYVYYRLVLLYYDNRFSRTGVAPEGLKVKVVNGAFDTYVPKGREAVTTIRASSCMANLTETERSAQSNAQIKFRSLNTSGIRTRNHQFLNEYKFNYEGSVDDELSQTRMFNQQVAFFANSAIRRRNRQSFVMARQLVHLLVRLREYSNLRRLYFCQVAWFLGHVGRLSAHPHISNVCSAMLLRLFTTLGRILDVM